MDEQELPSPTPEDLSSHVKVSGVPCIHGELFGYPCNHTLGLSDEDPQETYTIYLSAPNKGESYEDTYQGYMTLFKKLFQLANPNFTWRDFNMDEDGYVSTLAPLLPTQCTGDLKDAPKVIAKYPPSSWCMLLRYMGVEVQLPTVEFEEDVALTFTDLEVTRSAVEWSASMRPELTDFLWKLDVQGFQPHWCVGLHDKSFVVTNNGGFHRPTVLDYLEDLDDYSPSNPTSNLLLVPCAADKPYPSPMHKAVMDTLASCEAPDEDWIDTWTIAIVTGVLGIVPQDLWGVAPMYDSGVPNDWRAMQQVRKYIIKHKPVHIVSYCDYYNQAIEAALRDLPDGYKPEVQYVNPVKFYPDYLDLLDPDRLYSLKRCILKVNDSNGDSK